MREKQTGNDRWLITRRLGLKLVLEVMIFLHIDASLAALPSSMLDWMQGPPPLNGRAAYTEVHAETRLKEFNPQLLQSNELKSSTQWQSVVSNLQPFRSVVDHHLGMVFWRKDFYDNCPATAGCSFYGEVFGFNQQYVYLRMESFPVFGPPIDDGKTWDIRPDKFRLASSSDNGGDDFPAGLGRIWAPMRVRPGWKITQTFDTFACLSYKAFTTGTCIPYQKAFVDNSVSLEIWPHFSAVFDGEEPDYPADPEYKHFDEAIVIVQIMGNGQARERFFLAGDIDPHSGAFQSYGFVRWDDSFKDSQGEFVVVARTVGLRRAATQQVTFAGMRARGSVDAFQGASGLRIFHNDAVKYPTVDQTKPCPGDLQSVGSIHEPGMSLPPSAAELTDLSGFSIHSGGWVGVCYDPKRTSTEFILPSACPKVQQRGSLFVSEGYAKEKLDESTRGLVPVKNGWMVLCAMRPTDRTSYFSVARAGCSAGGKALGALRAYRDCYDAMGRRCERTQPTDSMIFCSRS